MLSTEDAIEQAIRQANLFSIGEKNTANVHGTEVKGDVVKYINRRGSVYYLKKSLTKLGKIQHSTIMNISKVDLADLATEIPSGFEFYESPREGQVYFRMAVFRNCNGFFAIVIDFRS